MPHCNNCERFVSERFVRVFGNNDGSVNGCVHCLTNGALYDGAAGRSTPDVNDSDTRLSSS